MEWVIGIIVGLIIIVICAVSNKQEEQIKAQQQKQVEDLVRDMAEHGIYINPYASANTQTRRNGAYKRGFTGYCRNCGHQGYFTTYDVIPQPYPHGTCPYCQNWVAVF